MGSETVTYKAGGMIPGTAPAAAAAGVVDGIGWDCKVVMEDVVDIIL